MRNELYHGSNKPMWEGGVVLGFILGSGTKVEVGIHVILPSTCGNTTKVEVGNKVTAILSLVPEPTPKLGVMQYIL